MPTTSKPAVSGSASPPKITVLSSTVNPNKLTTFQAATFLAFESNDFQRDWHNVLLENRRQRWPTDALKHGLPRGNQSRFSLLPFRREKRQNYYRCVDILQWLKHNKLT